MYHLCISTMLILFWIKIRKLFVFYGKTRHSKQYIPLLHSTPPPAKRGKKVIKPDSYSISFSQIYVAISARNIKFKHPNSSLHGRLTIQHCYFNSLGFCFGVVWSLAGNFHMQQVYPKRKKERKNHQSLFKNLGYYLLFIYVTFCSKQNLKQHTKISAIKQNIK